MEIVLDAGIIQASLIPHDEIKCGRSTNEEIYKKIKDLLKAPDKTLYTEMDTLRRACENVRKYLKVSIEDPDEKKYVSSTLSRIVSEAFYLGYTAIPTPDFEYEIGIIYPFEGKEYIQLYKYNFTKGTYDFLEKPLNKKFERILKYHCDKDDRSLLKGSYYANTDALLTTDGRIDKSKKLCSIYPVFCIDNLSDQEINCLKYAKNRKEIIEYAKKYFRRIKEKVKSRDRSKYL